MSRTVRGIGFWNWDGVGNLDGWMVFLGDFHFIGLKGMGLDEI